MPFTIPHPQSMPWQEDPFGILHRLFWNEHATDPDEGVFRALGIVHLYASSGIHLYAFLHAMEAMAYPLARRFGLDLRLTKRVALGSGLALLLWGWALQSFRPGFARPLVTYFVRRWGEQYGARFRVLAPLAVTLAVDLLLDFGGGRGHYYLAITGALLAMERLRPPADPDGARARAPPGVLATHVALSVGSWVLTAPLDLVLEHRIAWATPLYSLLTLPVLSHALYPATLLSLAVDGAVHPLLLDGWRAFMRVVAWLAHALPGPIVAPPEAIGIGASIAAIVTLGLRYRPLSEPGTRARTIRRCLALAGVAALITRPFTRVASAVIQLDVGQGDALLIRRADRVELVDAGPERGLRSGDWITTLSSRQVRRIDAILLTHLDADHVLGLTRLLPWVEVGCVETHPRHWASPRGQRLARFLEREFPGVGRSAGGCFRSGVVDWFGSAATARAGSPHGNDWMAGVVIPLAPGHAYFGAGDGDEGQEAQYARRFADLIATTPHRIWKLGHHGSRHSSAMSFLRSLDPEAVWISVGARNAYRHPSPLTLQRLRALGYGGRVQRTDVDGDLTAKISQPSRFRIREYWPRK